MLSCGVLQVLLEEVREIVHQLDLAELRDRMKENIEHKQQEQKERYDRARRTAVTYKAGDLILVRITSDPATGSSRKLHPKFKGSFRYDLNFTEYVGKPS